MFDRMPSFQPRDRSSVSEARTSGNGGHVGIDAPSGFSLPGGTTSPSSVASCASDSAITERYGMPRPACTVGSIRW